MAKQKALIAGVAFLGFVLLLDVYSTRAYAVLGVGDEVHDPIAEGILHLQQTQSETFHTFMRLQIVQSAIVIKNEFLAAQTYYNYIKQRSMHRGGLIGSYRDELTQVMQAELQNEKSQLLSEATNQTGATVIDDFMLLTTTLTGQKVDAASQKLLAAQKSAQASADVVYLNATNNDVARMNNAVRNWQWAQGVMRQAEYNKNATLVASCAIAINNSQARMQQLIQQLTAQEQNVSSSDLSDTDYEAYSSAMTSIRARIEVEQYKMEALRATMQQAEYSQTTMDQARGLVNDGLLPVPNTQ